MNAKKGGFGRCWSLLPFGHDVVGGQYGWPILTINIVLASTSSLSSWTAALSVSPPNSDSATDVVIALVLLSAIKRGKRI